MMASATPPMMMRASGRYRTSSSSPSPSPRRRAPDAPRKSRHHLESDSRRDHHRVQVTHSQTDSSHRTKSREPSFHTSVRPTISEPTGGGVMPVAQPLPSDDVLNALFDRLTDRMSLSAEKVAELNMQSREQRWSLILARHELQAGTACVFYIEQLVRHAQPQLKEKRPRRRLMQNLQPLAKVLSDLEVDLRTNPNDSWVSEFVNSPNHGHVALIDLIKDLADNPYSVPRKNPRKYAILDRDPSLLYTSLLCLKALASHRSGFSAVLSYDPSLCVLAYCLNNQNNRVRVLVLKLMVTVLLTHSGHRKVMQAFNYFRAIMKERTRFQLLVASLTEDPIDPTYQAAALCLINTVVQTAHGQNSKVFYQHEFIEAGFSVEDVEKSLHGRQDERVLHELKEWQNNFIDVQQVMDDLAVTRGKARNLQEELERTAMHLHEANIDREAMYEQSKKVSIKMEDLMERSEKQREKIAKLTDSINDLLEVKLERDELLEEKTQLFEANKRYHLHTTELTEKIDVLLEENQALRDHSEQVQDLEKQVQTLRHLQSMVEGGTQTSESLIDLTEAIDAAPPINANIPEAPPPPPIQSEGGLIPLAPPIPFGNPLAFKGAPPGIPIKKPVIPNVPLPMLNWIPIKNPEHTVFKDMDDEMVIETVDFSEFESLFQVQRFNKTDKQMKREETLKKISEQLSLMETNRARNLVIAKRRIGYTSHQIRDFILLTDLDALLPEHCELLLKFIPTKEELAELAKNASRFGAFGEAEQFLYQLAKIDHYEARLSSMAYMGSFDEVITTAQPQVEAVLSASLSIFRSSRLRKVFEIILAFGNYMNSSRRGAVYGFKLESLGKLMDTKSLDRKQTLLHYIIHVVETIYPNVLSFYDDLDIETACQVSMQIISEDVSNLQTGLQQLEEEKEREPDNFILYSFHCHAYHKVAILTETYSKMEDAYREVCLMFSESPKTTEPSDFFGTFQKFIQDWKKAIQENHEKKRRRKMAPASHLLRKQSQDEAKNKMADLAAEAAATAASRTTKIREEAQKIADRQESEEREKERRRATGEVVQNPNEEIHDIIKEKGVHRMNLTDKIPWLKDLSGTPVREGEGEGEGGEGERGDVLSPDSGVVDRLSDGVMESPIPTHLQNGEQEEEEEEERGRKANFVLEPLIPSPDYPKQLPRRDYPQRGVGGGAENNLLADNDYYSLMLAN